MTLIITYFLNIIRIIFDTLAFYLDIRDIDNKRLKYLAKAGTLLISIIIYVALPLTNIDITNIIWRNFKIYYINLSTDRAETKSNMVNKNPPLRQ